MRQIELAPGQTFARARAARLRVTSGMRRAGTADSESLDRAVWNRARLPDRELTGRADVVRRMAFAGCRDPGHMPVFLSLCTTLFIEMENARKRDARRNTEPTTVPIDTPDAPPHRRSTLYDPDPPPGEDSDLAVSSTAPNDHDSKSHGEHTEELA